MAASPEHSRQETQGKLAINALHRRAQKRGLNARFGVAGILPVENATAKVSLGKSNTGIGLGRARKPSGVAASLEGPLPFDPFRCIRCTMACCIRGTHATTVPGLANRGFLRCAACEKRKRGGTPCAPPLEWPPLYPIIRTCTSHRRSTSDRRRRSTPEWCRVPACPRRPKRRTAAPCPRCCRRPDTPGCPCRSRS